MVFADCADFSKTFFFWKQQLQKIKVLVIKSLFGHLLKKDGFPLASIAGVEPIFQKLPALCAFLLIG